MGSQRGAESRESYIRKDLARNPRSLKHLDGRFARDDARAIRVTLSKKLAEEANFVVGVVVFGLAGRWRGKSQLGELRERGWAF